MALCQIDSVVGDLVGNADKLVSWLRRAEEAGADLALFPELAITGYPPEDLLLKPGFIADNLAMAAKVAAEARECAAVFGYVDAGRDLHNALMVAHMGEICGTYHKELLPNYAVFDEKRYFTPGRGTHQLYRIAGVTVGLTVCEDAWAPAGPIASQAAAGAEVILSANASPFAAGRLAQREAMLSTRAADASAALVYVNLIGGQDELVFDGGSMAFDSEGNLLVRAKQFEEELLIADLHVRPVFRKRLLDPRGRASAKTLAVSELSTATRAAEALPESPPRTALSRYGEIYEALVLGTRDYVSKNGFGEVVIGLSGGVDSSLVAAVATDALGAKHVHGVAMPSRYSSPGSITDADQLSEALGIDLKVIPIEAAHSTIASMLGECFPDIPSGVADENLQSRIRGVLLMAMSNQFGWLVLTTGNKSEQAVGYSTLYGDSAGGFAVLKDVTKTSVYELCRYRNGLDKSGGPIPQSVIDKPPSAELRPDQKDQDSLPPYEVLDPIIEAYVEADRTAGELVEAGFDADLVAKVVRLVDLSEYKRRQQPPGVRVTPKAFGKDRRVPITNHYR